MLSTIVNNLKLGYYPKFRLFLYPKSKFHKHPKSNIEINGKFEFGCTWKGSAYKSSSLNISENGLFKINGNFRTLTGAFISISNNAKLEIGSGYSNYNLDITCFKSIYIGNNVAISKNVIIRDSDSHIINGNTKNVTKPIIIEDNVWIGMNAIILKGVNLGKGCIVAAGAIVTKNVPPHTLVGGVPAKVIKTNVFWE